MKNLRHLVFVSGIVLFGLNLSENPASSLSNSVKYQVQWSGKKGAKLYGSYSISFLHSPSTPIRVEKVDANLPHTLSFSTPKNALIGASGFTLNQGSVEIKIYKNGHVCGKEVVTGSGAMANKVCQ